MEFTFKIDPEEFGRMISAFPPEVRQQFIDSAIKAYPMMMAEMMKNSAFKFPQQQDDFNPFDPFGIWKNIGKGYKG
jgi:hypothetical protein